MVCTAASNRSQSSAGPRRPVPVRSSYRGWAPWAPGMGRHSRPARSAFSQACRPAWGASARVRRREEKSASGGAILRPVIVCAHAGLASSSRCAARSLGSGSDARIAGWSGPESGTPGRLGHRTRAGRRLRSCCWRRRSARARIAEFGVAGRSSARRSASRGSSCRRSVTDAELVSDLGSQALRFCSTALKFGWPVVGEPRAFRGQVEVMACTGPGAMA